MGTKSNIQWTDDTHNFWREFPEVTAQRIESEKKSNMEAQAA